MQVHNQIIKFFLIFSTTTSFIVCSYAQKIYEIKSCKIEFAFFDGIKTGTKTLVFTDSGRIEKMASTAKIDSVKAQLFAGMFGDRVIYNSLMIQTHDSVYTVDLDLKKGNRQKRNGLMINIDEMKMVIGQGTVLNRKCDIVELAGGIKIWYWNGIAIKKEIPTSEEKIYEYATAIDEKYMVTPNDFKIPDGITWN